MTDLLREGYCVQYLSTYSPFVCFESITGVRDRVLRSTTRGPEIHFWPTAEAAAAWLDAIGYAEGDPVPLGVGHMRIAVRPFAIDLVDPAWCRGSLFEIPAHLQRPRVALDAIPAPVPEPTPEPPPPVVVEPPRQPAYGPYRDAAATHHARPRSRPAAGQGSLF